MTTTYYAREIDAGNGPQYFNGLLSEWMTAPATEY